MIFKKKRSKHPFFTSHLHNVNKIINSITAQGNIKMKKNLLNNINSVK